VPLPPYCSYDVDKMSELEAVRRDGSREGAEDAALRAAPGYVRAPNSQND